MLTIHYYLKHILWTFAAGWIWKQSLCWWYRHLFLSCYTKHNKLTIWVTYSINVLLQMTSDSILSTVSHSAFLTKLTFTFANSFHSLKVHLCSLPLLLVKVKITVLALMIYIYINTHIWINMLYNSAFTNYFYLFLTLCNIQIWPFPSLNLQKKCIQD